MSEYWVSQAKHYCKYCNQWMADNKMSRLTHEGGVKHKANVEAFQKKKRDEKLHGARDEEDLRRQLAEIDRAAKEAVREDRVQSAGMFASVASSNASGARGGGDGSSYARRPQHQQSEVAEEETNGRRKGFYMVRGQGYLEGESNENLLVSNTTCQFFVEVLDDWMSAVIVSRRVVPVPNTELTLKTFTVDYKNDGNGVWIREDGVKSDKLRLLATIDGEPTEVDGSPIKGLEPQFVAAAAPVVPVKPQINEATGISGWQTVSVMMVDEEEQRRQRIVDEAKEKEALAAAEQAVKLAAMKASADDVDDAASRSLYKGVPIGRPVVVEAGDVNLSRGQTISFKKRKTTNVDEVSPATSAVESKSLSSEAANDNSSSSVVKSESSGCNSSSSKKMRNIRKRTVDDDDE